MARYSKDHKEKSRMRILEAASKLFRRDGYAKTGIDDIMAEAGLTSGAFYHHFDSKDQLFEESINTIFSQHRQLFLEGQLEKKGVDFLHGVVKRYLSREHRDHPETGCSAPSLGGEVSRSNVEIKDKFEKEFLITKSEIESRLPMHDTLKPQQLAIAILACCAGTTMLARSLKNKKLSDEVLLASRKYIFSMFS